VHDPHGDAVAVDQPGHKGLGEGGEIAPTAITNAANDALKGLGVERLVSPVTPRGVVEAIGGPETREGRCPSMGR
jgi:carbon-monoxide dehydrogenase large subunit